MRNLFLPLTVVTAAMFAYAPVAIAGAPYESTMLLIQKIFYFHVPAWMAMYAGIAVCGISSVIYLFKGRPAADRLAVSAAELIVLFGAIGLVTGPLWGRKAWGVWWQWDARLTMALLLELVFVAYLLVRAYGGPGSDKLAAAVGLFGLAVSPFVYVSVNIWRTIHPLNTVVPTLQPGMRGPFWFCALAFLMLFALLLNLRVYLATEQTRLDELYLAEEDSAA
ncbi:MAG TPA: cytochrome c biogenesis protein CcsA [Vicinamibacterales bacterium]|jgi:heme exporter protein C|nr:cytochrome c biogenesis protein CcsA [Vicinamibacterales bacterium]